MERGEGIEDGEGGEWRWEGELRMERGEGIEDGERGGWKGEKGGWKRGREESRMFYECEISFTLQVQK